MAIFNNYSNFNKQANFSSVVIGADAPVLEVELNEMQEIQRERLKSTLKLLFIDGVKGVGTYSYNTSSKILTISDELIILDGEILEITECSVSANKGDTIYIEVWEEEVTYADLIPKYGDTTSRIYIENHILDERVGEETSRRKQTLFKVSTTLPTENPYLILGEIRGEDFTLIAENMLRSVGTDSNKENLQPNKYVTVDSLDGSSRYKVYVSHKGELITEPTDKSTPQHPKIVLKATDGSIWTTYVDTTGELTTKATPSGITTSSVYLQSAEPYAVIYKLGVTEEGELTTSPICDLDLIHDNYVSDDTTWSSLKISKLVTDLTTELERLQGELQSLKAQFRLGGEE